MPFLFQLVPRLIPMLNGKNSNDIERSDVDKVRARISKI